MAHAEVMDTDPTRTPSSPLVQPLGQVDLINKDEHSLVEVPTDPIDGKDDYQVRLFRAWGSVGLIGLLVARAIRNTKR